ncbi:MAG: cation diffusion facilitator family transporter [Firmicutes bacterium]|nr:cation diffusion facilitator family transporter [Bacillota bacterium]
MSYTKDEMQAVIYKMSAVGIIGNVLLAALKFYAGIVGKSSAMVSDAVHSLSDVLATVIAFAGVKISSKIADENHPYGHEKFECLASLVLGGILAATGVGIGLAGIKKILAGDYENTEMQAVLPLAAAVISIASKEAMYHYTKYYAKKLDSAAFMADAWHHRSDAISSVGAFAGIGASMLGYPIMDSVASILICLMILKVAFDIIKDSVDKLTDSSCGSDLEEELAGCIMAVDGVLGIDVLQTRMFSNVIYVDVEIVASREISFLESHEIAEHVHDKIEQEFEKVKHVMVHVNPSDFK